MNGFNAVPNSLIDGQFSVFLFEVGELEEKVAMTIHGVNIKSLLLNEDGLEKGSKLYH